MSDQPKIRIKKVKPYPFPVQIAAADKPHLGNVVKMTQIGFLMNTGPDFLHVGEKAIATFSLPVDSTPIQVNVVVIRTWDKATEKLAELHFKEITPEAFKHITDFLRKIGQIQA